MLIDAEDPWARGVAPLAQLPLQEILEPALDGGSADVFSPPQAAAVDTIIMGHRHASSEWLGGSFTRQNARESFPEGALAILALELARLQFQDAMPQSPTFVPRLTPALVLASQATAVAMRAGFRSHMPGRNPHRPRSFFDACNLLSRQT